MKKIKYRILLILAIASVMTLISLASPAPSLAANEQPNVTIHFFWGDGCQHCAAEKPVLQKFLDRYPFVELKSYEVWYNAANLELLKDFAAVLGFEPRGVPVTVICGRVWQGFSDSYAQEMEAELQRYQTAVCQADTAALLAADHKTLVPTSQPGSASTPAPELSVQDPGKPPAQPSIEIPFFGKVDLATHSLAFSSAVIGFVDGFNPCSLWVLSVLLAITLYSGSRLKVLVVGGTFILISTLVYALFIAGVFTFFSYVGYLRWIQVGIALVAITFGLVNLKDYLWYKQGVSFTISDAKKPGLYKNMRSAIVTPRSLIGLIASTAVFAVGVSLIEFSCTAGFPVIWSNLMIANQVSRLEFVLLLALYMFIYMLDELAIFLAAVFTMRASKMEEKHGRLLKLISGMLMVCLGVVMFVNPELMNSLGSSLLVFLAAAGLVLLALILHRVILPRLGVRLGIDSPKKRRRH